MNKTIFSIALIAVVITLLVSSVAGCARPKPEPKLTPTATVVEPAATNTPVAAPTQVIAEPTVVTTKPTQIAPQPTSGAAQEAAATPTPVVIATVPTSSTPAVSSPEANWFLYTVRWGDTLYSLAARYGTTVEAISALNGISRPDQIQAGQQIKIPKSGAAAPPSETAAEYIVQAGDNLNAIANKFGVTVEALMRANGLTNPDFIYVGQKLVIPAAGVAEPAPSGGRTHVVKPGESIDMIAAMYGTTREAIVAANNLANPNWIYVGQVLRIP